MHLQERLTRLMTWCAAFAFGCSCLSCSEDIDTSDRYVFKYKTIVDYLASQEQYSEYLELLAHQPVSEISETTLRQLLSARGNYTIFAPTNEAIQAYLDTLYKEGIISEPSWDGFPSQLKRDSIERVIVFNSVIDGGDNTLYYTYDLPIRQDAEIPISSMYDRKLSVHYLEDSLHTTHIYISGARVDNRNCDIPLLNGVLHCVHNVVHPSDNLLGKFLFDNVEEKRLGFYVSSMITLACGLRDTLEKYMDFVYEQKFQRGEIPPYLMPVYVEGSTVIPAPGFCTPEHRYYGYTFFAETDSLWSALLGKEPLDITVEDVVDWLDAQGIYPDAKRSSDYTDENNLLNRFVTYHLVPMRLSTDHLVRHYNEKGYSPTLKTPSVAMCEYYVPMGKRRMLRLFESKESKGVWINRFPNLDNGRKGTYHELSCDPEKEGIRVGEPNIEGRNSLRNAMVYPIDRLLVYDEPTRSNLMKERIRFDITSIMPEFTNNDIRMSPISDVRHKNVYIPVNSVYNYLDDVEMSDETQFFYWTGLGNGWANYHGDEMTIRGLQDVTFRLPPVPKRGTYEIRYASQIIGRMRGIVQFYWGKDKTRLAPMGIPMDLRIGPTIKRTATGDMPSYMGWEPDTKDEDYDAEVDKRLRNNGFMKGAEIHYNAGPESGTTARASELNLRRIIIRQTMDPDEVYYIRFKTVMDDPTRYLYMDYLEYCAKEIYDNPETPEDIW